MRTVTRLSCPLRTCSWHLDDVGVEVSEQLFAADLTSLMREHTMSIEGDVRTHLETHDVAEWAAEVAQLKNELTAAKPSVEVGSWPWTR